MRCMTKILSAFNVAAVMRPDLIESDSGLKAEYTKKLNSAQHVG